MRLKRLLLSAAVALAAALPVIALGAVPAQAQVGNPTCPFFALCLYYPAKINGHKSAFTSYPTGTPMPDLTGEVFNGGNPDYNGYNLPVVGNIGTAENLNTTGTYYVVLCSGTNYTGLCQVIAADSEIINTPFLLSVHSFYWGVGA
ncbi:hypothetical protein [Rugosimonospora africana]|uniref:Uncharacterized protein n=1 Tax=Rugosimonospora africana TaxID=556532 RepID=A0A8J3R0X7_9ACTN|nr:hypothetical protein [Rugosimonospora africana]GIH20463.1 hypothetical protein Raf01_86350 [Rugosimonospora africana]